MASFMDRYNNQIRNKRHVAAATRDALEMLREDTTPSFEDYAAQLRADDPIARPGNARPSQQRQRLRRQPNLIPASPGAARPSSARPRPARPSPAAPSRAVPSSARPASPRSRPRPRPTAAQHAEEELRRSYQARFGGDYSLREYQQIAREDARFSQYRRDEALPVVHRRGDLDIVLRRRPQESAVDRVENAYRVAMAQESYCGRIDEEPYRGIDASDQAPPPPPEPQPAHHRPQQQQQRAYEEQAFERRFDGLRMADINKPDPAPHRRQNRDHRGVPCFNIPPANRDAGMHRVGGFVKHPKLTYHPKGPLDPRPRGTVRGKAIRKIDAPPVGSYWRFDM